MKIRKLFAGMAAAVLATATLAVSASAANIFDYYDAEEAAANDANLGAMAFFMSQKWNWCQGAWCPLEEDGTVHCEYDIMPVKADKTMSGAGTLGDMGLMICNVPDGGYPYDIIVTKCEFIPCTDDECTQFDESKKTVFQSVLDKTSWEEDSEGGIRIHIRPVEGADEDGNVVVAATPEAAGWEEEGAFYGGKLLIDIDFQQPGGASGEESQPDESTAEPATDTANKNNDTNNTNTNTTGTTPAASNDNQKTGAAETAALALAAVAAAAGIVAKKRH